MEILSVNTILFTYRMCSIWPPPSSIHLVYRLIMSCRTLGFRYITGDSSCYLYSYHKILLFLHGSLVHQDFHALPEMEIQWCQVRWARGPGYWASTSSPSVAKGVNQVETQQDLVARIQVATGVIRDMPGIFPRVRRDIIRRYTKCIKVGHGHIEHLL